MNTLLRSETRKARKNHRCDACHWLLSESGDIDYLAREHGLTESEVSSLKLAEKNGWGIKKGDKYLYQTGKYDGEMCTFKAIPAVDDICQKYEIYPDY
jgi:hypothetical protein